MRRWSEVATIRMNVIDAIVGQRLHHLVEQALANIGPAHLRQRQAHVVDRDRHAHVWIELREQRVRVLRGATAHSESPGRDRRSASSGGGG